MPRLKLTAKIQKGKSKDLQKLERNLEKLHNEYVEVGYFNGEMHSNDKLSYASLMTVMEFGRIDNSIQPFHLFQNLTYIYDPVGTTELRMLIKKALQSLMTRDVSTKLLTDIGRFYQRKARSMFGVPSMTRDNEAGWAERKGGNNPLILTGELRDNLGFRTSKTKTVIK